MEKEKKAKKPKKRMSAKKLTIVWTPFIVINLILCVLANYLGFTKFFAVANRYFGSAEGKLVASSDNKLIDANYYTSDFESTDDLNAYEEALCEQIAAEGVVVLENKGLLPMESSRSLSLFSQSSVNLVYGGTGSGTVSTDACVNLKTALEEEGFTVNQKLWDFYATGNGSGFKRGEGAVFYGMAEDWTINECPLSTILAEDGMESSFAGTTAVFVLSRTGGEGKDLARGMYKFTQNPEDQVKHYLEPNSDELEILSYLNENFEDVLLIVNTNNAMELGWVSDFENIKAVISCPGMGLNGTEGLAKVIDGAVSPSGKLVDTFAYDNFSAPSTNNIGEFEFTVNNAPSGINFVNYVEGIYVGYRYYETRYEDTILGTGNAGDYAYDSTVLYPFGYGLSYTSFEWSDYKLVDNGDSLVATVTVTNTGDVAGKDVVELYFSSPYTQYDIDNLVEKSSVELAGFDKTETLEPGESQTLTIELDKELLRAYDRLAAKGYILDAGDYYVTAATDAHTAVNNVLMAKAADGIEINADAMVGQGNADLVGKYTVAELDTTTYKNDSATGEEITNLFDFADLEGTVYLTRNDWTGTYPASCGEQDPAAVSDSSNQVLDGNSTGFVYRYDVSGAVVSNYYATESGNTDLDVDISDISYGEKNGLELLQLRGLDYDDPLWDSLLDELTEQEVNDLIHLAGYQSTACPSINKPLMQDYDGPAGLNAVVGHAAVAMAYPCEVMIASTWNEDLALAMGTAMGEDGLATKIEGWYAPAVNIHRSAFAGRNFEYYSEDSFMAGTMAADAIKGAASKGMYSFLKHFALNDQENFRNGICTFANEQSIREIYLEAFERAIKGAGTVTERYYEITEDENGKHTYTEATAEVPAASAIMSSFNRIGTIWAGGNYNLLTGVLRNEWGFNGFVLTDYDNGGYMNTVQTVLAGGDAKLAQFSMDAFNCTDSDANQYYAREAAHHILYTTVNSSGMNGYALGTSYRDGMSYATPVIIGGSMVFALIALFGIIKVVRRHMSEKKEKECKVTLEN